MHRINDALYFMTYSDLNINVTAAFPGAKRRMVSKKRDESRDVSDSMSLHSIDELGATPRRGMRRSLSGFARRSLRNLKGTIKDKVSYFLNYSLLFSILAFNIWL